MPLSRYADPRFPYGKRVKGQVVVQGDQGWRSVCWGRMRGGEGSEEEWEWSAVDVHEDAFCCRPYELISSVDVSLMGSSEVALNVRGLATVNLNPAS